jgi:hypothetical protein
MLPLLEPGLRTETGGSSGFRGRVRLARGGQSLVEFALVLPLLLIVVLFALDLGRLFLGWVELNNAARIAANYASVHPTADWSNPNDPDVIRYTALIRNEADILNCTLPPTFPAPSFPGGTAFGETAKVGSRACSTS